MSRRLPLAQLRQVHHRRARDIEHVPIERLQAFYRKYYQPDNAMLVVAGKFDEAKALALDRRSTSARFPRPRAPLPRTYTEEPAQDGERAVTLRRVGDVQRARRRLPRARRAPTPTSPPSTCSPRCSATRPPAGCTRRWSSRRRPPAPAPSTSSCRTRACSCFSAEVARGPAARRRARRAAARPWRSAAATPFTEEEVERAKTRAAQAASSCTLNNSERVAIQLSEWAAIGDWRLLFLHRDRLEAVTPADVHARGRQAYLKPSNRTLGQFIPTAEAGPRRDAAARGRGRRCSRTTRAAPRWPQGEAFDPSPANIEARVQRSAAARRPEARAAAQEDARRDGERRPQPALRHREPLLGQQRRGATTPARMLMRGTKKHTRQQLKDALDKLKARVGVDGGATGRQRLHRDARARTCPQVLRAGGRGAARARLRRQGVRAAAAGAAGLAGGPAQRAGHPGPHRLLARAAQPLPQGPPATTCPRWRSDLAGVKAATLEQVRAFHRDVLRRLAGRARRGGRLRRRRQLAALVARAVRRLEEPARPTRACRSAFHDVAPQALALETPDKANAFFLAGQTCSCATTTRTTRR